MPIDHEVKNRFELWREFLKKNKGNFSREDLVRMFHAQYGYGVKGSSQPSKRRRRRVYCHDLS